MEGLDAEEWNAFKVKFNKKYESEEEEKSRMKIYLDNKKRFAEHNAKYDKGLETYTMGINQFADMKPGERTCCGTRTKCPPPRVKEIEVPSDEAAGN
ncbi:protein CTLA-2-beta-like [Athalia rosae]|uniref:protein CTLA-2-beta-like n=1 Tax=Athalia rosae TaxID=37344 RepID=UPI0020337BDA|nr:protein CTLA-2-beta-like [Athalia rosae]